jgi:hypothetical protein
VSYWAAFGLTLAAEAPLAALLSGRLWRRAACHSVLLNLATHPCLAALQRGCVWAMAELLVAEAVGHGGPRRLARACWSPPSAPATGLAPAGLNALPPPEDQQSQRSWGGGGAVKHRCGQGLVAG